MKEFTSSFVAIPLPAELKAQYMEITDEVAGEFPEVKLVSRENPHITVLYLKKSSIGRPEVTEGVRQRLEMIRGGHVGIGGFGYFRGDNPRVLFLNVDYPFGLEKYRTEVSAVLAGYTAPENILSFHPHLTVGSIVGWKEFDIKVFNSRIRKRKWNFGIRELGIYGADSKQKPEYQKLLETIGYSD